MHLTRRNFVAMVIGGLAAPRIPLIGGPFQDSILPAGVWQRHAVRCYVSRTSGLIEFRVEGALKWLETSVNTSEHGTEGETICIACDCRLSPYRRSAAAAAHRLLIMFRRVDNGDSISWTDGLPRSKGGHLITEMENIYASAPASPPLVITTEPNYFMRCTAGSAGSPTRTFFQPLPPEVCLD